MKRWMKTSRLPAAKKNSAQWPWSFRCSTFSAKHCGFCQPSAIVKPALVICDRRNSRLNLLGLLTTLHLPNLAGPLWSRITYKSPRDGQCVRWPHVSSLPESCSTRLLRARNGSGGGCFLLLCPLIHPVVNGFVEELRILRLPRVIGFRRGNTASSTAHGAFAAW